ncbi:MULTISPECIES: AAA family ATPase [Thermocrispum]|jgi:Mrp family chromosome partitioning ATPase|uniref:AAA family ATPase n=1 Tax=Thermocrispum agreste TaxID=37925 RepID=A0A2W4JNW4_9PSEU|nr:MULTISPECIES: AAA family ATPase [Thermocrispum]PZN00765.1 MAG: cell shape-determining protein [Thermocrispum agreste]
MDELPSPRLVDAVWRYRTSSLIIVGVAVLLSVLVALIVGEPSRMQARLALKTPDKAGVLGVESGETAFARYANQRALFVTSDKVIAGAMEKLGGSVTQETLRDAVTAEASDTGESLVLQVAAGSPEEASRIMRAVIESYREASRAEVAQRVKALLDTLAEQRKSIEERLADTPEGTRRSANTEAAAQSLSELDKRATELKVAASQIGDGVAFVYDTEPDRTALLRAVARDGVIGFGVGGVIAVAVAWFRADRDRRVGNLAELEALVDEPVLGEIEHVSRDEAAALLWLGAPPSKTYRMVAFGVQQVIDEGVLIVTGESGSGVTTTTIQLASALARSGLNVLLVDGAVRTHGLSTSIGLAAKQPYGNEDDHRKHPGLTDIAMGNVRPQNTMRVVELGDGVTLTVIPAGAYVDGVLERFSVPLLDRAIGEMRAQFDIVLIDAPTPASAPEAGALVRASDAVIVVVRRDADAAGLRRLIEQIRIVGGKVAGYVLTFATRNR